MSSKTCLFVTALLLPACIAPAVQGMSTATDDTSGTESSGTTEPTTGPTTGPTTTDSGTSIGTTDPVATCSDGQKNQDESDVDCGGSCPPCDADAMCGGDADCESGKCEAMTCFPLARSCLELHMLKADLPSGAYPLDPDGDGANPGEFFCDMEPASPGWTQVFLDELDPAAMGVWDPVVTGECGDSGAILGPYGMGQALALGITAQQVPHSELRVVAEVVIMDSWDLFDNDLFQVKLGGAEIFSHNCDEPNVDTCNQAMNLCNNAMFKDAEMPISTDPAAHDADAIALEFTSNLNEPADAESWGLDKVAVFVK